VNALNYIIEKIKEYFRPRQKLAPPMPKTRKPRAKKEPAKITAKKKVTK
jgi:hypothetical protein